MAPDHQKLKTELDIAFEATETFIVNYSVRMQHPVKFVSSIVASLKKSDDRIINLAHLDTLQRTLFQMDKILKELMQVLSTPTTPDCERSAGVPEETHYNENYGTNG